ncbi:HDOD domain-containing protein [Nitrogeniibacter mangrovi]|uniref:HDOD domain-containing protein n=1 Tax=Nitrogeniibacter mangrovi TaxID=2016596 RepID=A0A6C1B0A4_9RHOO|nr:HDOD domain-containing protein [Nitrogeniibacter mangrovi]QID17041.1 HDOD domain-containing protein [Nitrogeniibacter mangrovi]
MHPELDFEDIPPLPAEPPRGLSGWIAHIREQDMPAFGNIVDAVRSIVTDESASASRLASVILRDQAMTTKVLRLANSAYFNASHHGVSTISRAIVVLGFDTVADMAVGLALVDALLRGGVRGRVTQEMARCFFAATVARGLARMHGEGRAEEVFIAALLARVGEMAFWCFGGSQAEVLDEQLGAVADDAKIQSAQQVVLGFRLRQLTVQLAREWRLGSLLIESFDSSPRPSALVTSIRLGHAIAQAVGHGWDSPAMHEAIAEAARFVGLPAADLNEELERLATEAAHLAAGYGAGEAAEAIPSPKRQARAPAPPVVEAPPESPAERQLNILRELSVRIMSGANFADVVYLACEGILHGVGFDRVIVALVTPNRRQVVGKYALGSQSEGLARQFVFTLGEVANDPIDQVFATLKPIRANRPRGRLQAVVGAGPFCMAPLVGQGRCIGLVYAERDTPGQIDDESYFAVAHFVQHMTMAVQALRPSAG